VAAVAARLGYDPFSPWGDQTVLATVARSGTGLVARAELIDHDGIAQGSREVRNSECSELILALALAISITLDPLHVASPAPPEPAPAAAPPPTPVEVAPPAAAPPPAPVRPPRSSTTRALRGKPSDSGERLTWRVGAAGIGAVEVAPHFALGARVVLEARRGLWALGLEGWGTLPAAQAGAEGGEVQVRPLSAALAPCFRLVDAVALCALGSLGFLRAEGRGVDAPRSEYVVYATAGVRGLLTLPLGQAFELMANVDAAATLNRPSFRLDNAQVWRPGPVVALLGIGASVRFY
jgi:hypothetical protein